MNQYRLTDSGHLPAAGMQELESHRIASEAAELEMQENDQGTKTNYGMPAVAIAADFANSGTEKKRAKNAQRIQATPVKQTAPIAEPDKDDEGYIVLPAVEEDKPNAEVKSKVEIPKVETIQTRLDGLYNDISALERNIAVLTYGPHLKKIGKPFEGEKNDRELYNEDCKISYGDSSLVASSLNMEADSIGKKILQKKDDKNKAQEKVQLSRLRDRLNDANEYFKNYQELLNAHDILADNEKLYSYSTPMNMRNGNPASRVKNRIKLHAKIGALETLKKKRSYSNGRTRFESFLHNHSVTPYGRIVDTIETELRELDDWELIARYQKIMERPLRAKKQTAVSKPQPEKKKSWFGNVLKTAAAIGIGVAATLGYQHYSKPSEQVEKPRPIMSGGYVIGFENSGRKYEYNSLSLEDVTRKDSEPRKDLSFKLIVD